MQVSGWTPELEELWQPFLQPTRPLIVTVEDPLFVELHKGPGVFYRDRSLNKLEDLNEFIRCCSSPRCNKERSGYAQSSLHGLRRSYGRVPRRKVSGLTTAEYLAGQDQRTFLATACG